MDPVSPILPPQPAFVPGLPGQSEVTGTPEACGGGGLPAPCGLRPPGRFSPSWPHPLLPSISLNHRVGRRGSPGRPGVTEECETRSSLPLAGRERGWGSHSRSAASHPASARRLQRLPSPGRERGRGEGVGSTNMARASLPRVGRPRVGVRAPCWSSPAPTPHLPLLLARGRRALAHAGLLSHPPSWPGSSRPSPSSGTAGRTRRGSPAQGREDGGGTWGGRSNVRTLFLTAGSS
jgi:hypothetical protein